MDTHAPDPYGTHQPLLMLAIANTDGPILELGSGHYSTPLLHAFAKKRGLLTIDNNLDWLAQFRSLESKWHVFNQTISWPDTTARLLHEGHRFSVCFVDHAPSEARGRVIAALRPIVDVFVCHDSQPCEGDVNGYVILDTFRYRLSDQRDPLTTIVSDTMDVWDWQ